MQKNQKLLYPLLVLCFSLLLVGFWLGRRSVRGVILTTEHAAPAAETAAPVLTEEPGAPDLTEEPAGARNTETAPEAPLVRSGELPAAQSGRIDLNAATLEELMTLPGIGEVRGQRIIEYREANGPFRSTAELMNVYGIGEGIYAGLRDLVYVEDADENTDH